MASTYETVVNTITEDILPGFSRIVLVIMYSLFSKVVIGYHYVKDTYLKYKYATTHDSKPNHRYLLGKEGRQESVEGVTVVPTDNVYIEEWMDTKGHKKMTVRYTGETIPTSWEKTPFDGMPAKCPWVWVGDRETEVDLTRKFDTFLVPGNRITSELVSKMADTSLIYIETKTFNQIKFPGDGITIEADVD